MPSFGLIGPAYETFNRGIDSQRLINLYPELVESGAGAGGKFSYSHTPGFATFATLPQGPVRALWGGNERLFAIGGDHVYEIAANGTTITDIGAIGTATGPGQIVSNGTQLLVWDGSVAPVTSANTWLLTGAQAPIPVISSVGITYIDGYFVALRPAWPDYDCNVASVVSQNQRQFNLSALLDGSQWDPLDYAEDTSAPDQILAVLGPGSFNGGPEELWLLGRKTIRVWYNTGGTSLNPFPFERVHGAFINTGLWAAASVVGFKNTIVFLSASDRGVGPVVKMNGYIPERISNHAIEATIRGYITDGSDISNAVAYGYEENGHTFYVLTFPTANKQWVCDLTTNQWHERASGTDIATLTAAPAMFHAFVWGRHLVADLNSAVIRTASLGLYQQQGSSILRVRVAPHLNNEQLRVMYRSLWLKIGGQFNVTRTYTLEVSNDGGFTYGTPKAISIGAGQQSTSRIEWRRLGLSRDRVFRITTTDNQPQAWVDGYVEFEAGTGG